LLSFVGLSIKDDQRSRLGYEKVEFPVVTSPKYYNITRLDEPIGMSEFAFFRFLSNDLLTEEEKAPENKQEIVNIVEEVEKAEGIDCDRVVSKMSEDELKGLLEKVRNKRRKKKMQHIEEGEAEQKLVTVASDT
jgi:hypothetical protein